MQSPSQRPASALPDDLVIQATAPQRLVVVWACQELPSLAQQLNDAGLWSLFLPPEDTPDLIEIAGAPGLMLVDAELLDDLVVAALNQMREASPRTRVVLLAGPTTSPLSLLRALQSGLSKVVDPTNPEAVHELLHDELSRAPTERILAIGAHPDDVEIGCGATLLSHRNQDHPVTVLTMSRGAVGGPREQRRLESISTAIELSAELIMGDLPDTRIEDAHEATTLIENVIGVVQPTTVYVHSEHDNHQDHRAVHRAALIAARRVPHLLCYQSPSSRNGFAPTKFVPVDDTIDGKVKLLAHYRSQATRPYLDPELVVATARYWARQLIDHRYAEPFEVLRSS